MSEEPSSLSLLPKVSWSRRVEEGLEGQSRSAIAVLSHHEARHHPAPPTAYVPARNPGCDLYYVVSYISDRRSEGRRAVNRYSTWRSSGGECH